jgi:FkbM family methyltransferase
MESFKSILKKELLKSLDNNFGVENYDEHRFGPIIADVNQGNSFFAAKQKIKKLIGYQNVQNNSTAEELIKQIDKYEVGLDYLYNNVSPESRDLVVQIVAFRLLGYSKVKLAFNNKEYWESLERVKTLKDGEDKYDPHFMHFILDKFDLKPIGFNIKLFFSEVGIAIDFIAEQYAYKNGNRAIVQAEQNDVVLDVGGCWGDTALYFADKVGANGKVYSFEFIPDNIKLHKINTSLNENLKDVIQLVANPVSDKSDIPIFYKDYGPGSKIAFQEFEDQTGATTTISIDDFVRENGISRIDFIKMDIEGAEPVALKGAVETIRKFKPKLAIAIYHSMDDFINIPKWILEINPDYELFIGHYTYTLRKQFALQNPGPDDQRYQNISSSV